MKEPERITIESISQERNATVKRAIIERFGLGRYVLHLGAEVIHQDNFGTLYRSTKWGMEPMVLVKVKNSTPEPDGTYREYFLRVPPDTVTAKQAVAWSFGIEEDQYDPDEES